MVPVRDRLLPAFAACVGEALGALAPPGDCAMVPSAGRSISSGSIPGFDVAVEVRLGAGLALGDGSPDCVGTAVAFGSATDGTLAQPTKGAGAPSASATGAATTPGHGLSQTGTNALLVLSLAGVAVVGGYLLLRARRTKN